MSKINTKLITRQISYAFIAAVMMLSYFPSVASAAQITSRSVVLGNSLASADTTYSFTFTVPTTGTVIHSVEIKACQEANTSCTAATGFSAASATLTGQPSAGLGDTSGWTDSSTATALRIANAGNVATPSGAATVNFAAVHNPSTTSTFYLQITTFTSSDWTTGTTDTGTIAASTAANVTVTANVDESLAFTVGSTSVVMTPGLTSSTTGKGTSTLSVGTNGPGYSIGYTGTTLTSGANTIDALATETASSVGAEQFGMNLVNNPALTLGAAPTGTGTVAGNYNTASSFTFITTGEPVATNAAATTDTYTVSYIANITAAQAPGAYSSTVNFVATANY